MDRNRAFSRRNSKLEYLLSGLCRCGVCNFAYVGDPSHGKPYYRCSSRSKPTPRTCTNGTVMAQKADAAVWKAISDAFLNPLLIFKHQEAVNQARTTHETPQISPDELDRQIQAIKASEERVLDAYTNGYATKAQMAAQMSKLKDRRIALERNIREAASPIPKREDIETYCRLLSIGLKVVESDFQKKRKVLRDHVTSVTITGRTLTVRGELLIINEWATPMPDCAPSRMRLCPQSVPFEIQVGVAD